MGSHTSIFSKDLPIFSDESPTNGILFTIPDWKEEASQYAAKRFRKKNEFIDVMVIKRGQTLMELDQNMITSDEMKFVVYFIKDEGGVHCFGSEGVFHNTLQEYKEKKEERRFVFFTEDDQKDETSFLERLKKREYYRDYQLEDQLVLWKVPELGSLEGIDSHLASCKQSKVIHQKPFHKDREGFVRKMKDGFSEDLGEEHKKLLNSKLMDKKLEFHFYWHIREVWNFMKDQSDVKFKNHKDFHLNLLKDLRRSNLPSIDLFWKLYDHVQKHYALLYPRQLIQVFHNVTDISDIICLMIRLTEELYIQVTNRKTQMSNSS